MELNQPEKAIEIEPLVDLNYDHVQTQVIRKGPTERTIFQQASDALSNTNVAFSNIAPASLTTITERCFRVKYKISATVKFPALKTATNADPYAGAGLYPIPNAVVGKGVTRAFPAGASAYVEGQPAYDPVTGVAASANPAIAAYNIGGGASNDYDYTMALRSFPLNSCLATIDLKLNGGSTSLGSNDVICLQPYLMKDKELMYFECPVQRDSSAMYSANSQIDDRNPFDTRIQNDNVPTRNSYTCTLLYENLTSNVVTRVYEWEIVEPLVISPLVWGNTFDDEGFANLNNITIQLRIQDINRALSLASGMATGSSVVMNLAQIQAPVTAGSVTMDLLLNYNTQDPLLAAKMASTLYYNWDLVQVDANSNSFGNTALNNASPAGQFNGNALRLSTIPDKIYVYIKPSKRNFGSNSNVTQTITDTFLRITNLRVQFQNTQNILGSFSEYDLWRMSVKNGLQMCWNDWKYANGSIVIIDTVADLGLKSDEAPGEGKYNQIKIDGSYDCTPLIYAGQTQAVLYDVMTMVVTGGEAVISPNSARFDTGGVDGASVLALTTMQDNKIQAAGFRRDNSPRGGSLLGNAGKYLHRGLKFLADNKDHVATGIDLAQKGLKHLGVGGALVGGDIVGGATVGGRLSRHRRVA